MTTATATPVLQARGLVKRYGHVTALDGADFELLPGEILAVIGDNGAGKSTLIKALSGALIPDEGEILLDGKPVQFHSPIDARRARHRDRLPGPRGGARDEHRREPVPRPRDAPRRLPRRSCCACWTRRRCSPMPIAHMKDLKIGIRSMKQAVETLSGGQRQGVAVARSAAFAGTS